MNKYSQVWNNSKYALKPTGHVAQWGGTCIAYALISLFWWWLEIPPFTNLHRIQGLMHPQGRWEMELKKSRFTVDWIIQSSQSLKKQKYLIKPLTLEIKTSKC